MSNPLVPLLAASAARYRTCELAIATALATALDAAQSGAMVEEPAQVPPCRLMPALLASAHDPLLDVVAPIAHLIHWRTPGKAMGTIPDAVGAAMAAAEIVGPSGMILNDDVRWGLFIQQPGFHYPEHCHAAEELYLILSGTADWGTEEKVPTPVAPGTFVHHPSWLAHIMVTGEQPLLAMWGWTGDIDFATYTMGRRPA